VEIECRPQPDECRQGHGTDVRGRFRFASAVWIDGLRFSGGPNNGAPPQPDDVALKYLAAYNGSEGILFVGWAQESRLPSSFLPLVGGIPPVVQRSSLNEPAVEWGEWDQST
jgi:hypothetical protein